MKAEAEAGGGVQKGERLQRQEKNYNWGEIGSLKPFSCRDPILRSEDGSDPELRLCNCVLTSFNYSQRAVTLVIIMFPRGIENQAVLWSGSIKTVCV